MTSDLPKCVHKIVKGLCRVCHPRLDWKVIDPYLGVTEAGALRRLANSLGISEVVLRKRRRKLKLARVSKGGRPPVVKLTGRELAIHALKAEGKTVKEMAEELGKSQQNINSAVMSISEKIKRQCPLCLGDQVVRCGHDGRPACSPADHSHICIKCGGKGHI